MVLKQTRHHTSDVSEATLRHRHKCQARNLTLPSPSHLRRHRGIAATTHVSPFRNNSHWKGHHRHELQDTRPVRQTPAGVALYAQKLTQPQTPLQAVPQARPRLERPPIPLARTGPVHPRTLRGQAQCYRAATDEGASPIPPPRLHRHSTYITATQRTLLMSRIGTDQGDGKLAREVEAPRPLPPTHGSWRFVANARIHFRTGRGYECTDGCCRIKVRAQPALPNHRS